jgi:hypothetical protein
VLIKTILLPSFLTSDNIETNQAVEPALCLAAEPQRVKGTRFQDYMKIAISCTLSIALFISCNSQDSPKVENLGKVKSPESTWASSNTPLILDTLIVRSINISDYLNDEKIIYRLQVRDWLNPVKWDFRIVNGLDTLFFYKSNYKEKNVDELLKVEDLWTDCSSYLECKMNWYLNEIHKIQIETIQPEDYRRERFKQTSEQFALLENSEYGSDKKTALNNLRKFWSIYTDKVLLVFVFNYDPEIGMTPMMAYHPVMKKFVPIWAP